MKTVILFKIGYYICTKLEYYEMRLGQLARKVNTKPAQIISFLEKEHNIIIEDNLNSKIEDKSLALVIDEFKTEEKVAELVKESIIIIEEEVVAEVLLEDDTTNESSDTESEEIITETTKEKIIDKEPLISIKETLTVLDEDGEEIELTVIDGVIKAQKKELEGFKVVGKIDLPEKKRSISFIITTGGESTDITEEIFDKKEAIVKRQKELYLERKKKRLEKTKKRKSGQRKVLSEMELKERANKLAVEKQIQKTKVNKELKKKRYKEQVQTKIVTNKVSKKKQQRNKSKLDKVNIKKPTTTWGKIVKWFNT